MKIKENIKVLKYEIRILTLVSNKYKTIIFCDLPKNYLEI